jgi:hypothetical protein
MLYSKFIFLVIASVFALWGCTDKSGDYTPKQRLEQYISKSFAVNRVEDREELVKYLVGPTKIRLASWSDEQFRRAFIETQRNFIRLLIREIKEVSQNEVSITYELSYFENPKKVNTRKTARRNAIMIKENGIWFIREVKNISEIIEYSNEMSLP